MMVHDTDRWDVALRLQLPDVQHDYVAAIIDGYVGETT